MILLGLGLAIILFGGGIALANRVPDTADRLFTWCFIGGCLLALVPAFSAFTGVPDRVPAPVLLALAPAASGIPFRIDELSAWFLFVVLGVGAALAAYGVPYLSRERLCRNVGRAHLLLAVLIVAMAGVVTARTVVAFLACWEVMALAAYFLVIFEHDRPGVWDAGMIYLVLTHASTLALIGMFAVWARGGAGWSFEDLARAGSANLVPVHLVLTLSLLGFGIKAGVFPFHFWLPGAHAAAPSHVSALLSGVMLKIGIYGLLRTLNLLGSPPAWWGWTVLALGLASSILGVLWALAQHDIKRLLAYHSVENIGIILLGLGLGALGTAYHQPAVALLGYAGALLHTLNHALFKSLLFLGAGAVVHATGTREIDRLGGLARRMPRTATLFLIGSAAIVGLPPLNGFVSEWLIFRGLLNGGIAEGALRVASVMVVGLALTSGLALACFSKLYGVVFLGTPRDPAVSPAHPEERRLHPPQFVLAACCIVIGVAPAVLLPAAIGTAMHSFPGGGWDAAPTDLGSFALSTMSGALLVLAGLVWAARGLTQARRARGSAVTWGCAHDHPSSRLQYTASSFASSLLGVFGPISGSRVDRTAGALHTHPFEPVLDALGRPLWRRLVEAANHLRTLQSGGMRWYLLYVILCLLGLLLYLRIRAPQ